MDEIETLEPDDLHPTRGRIGRRTDGPVEVVVKTARGGERAALRREAEVLRVVAGTEVVQLVELVDGPESTEMVVRSTGGPSLGAALADQDTTGATALQLLAGACDLVSRLHGRGWAHGRITADHVLLTARGRMRLCSLSAASPIEVDPDRATADRTALLRMVDDWTRSPAGPGREPGLGTRIRAEVLGRRTQRLPDDPDPRVLARILRRTGRTPGTSVRTSWWTIPVLAAMTLLAGWIALGVAATADSSAQRAASPDPDRSTTLVATTSTPPTTATSTVATSTTAPDPGPTTSLPTIATDGNAVVVDGRRYRVGIEGDLVAVGDWDCDGSATPAVLRPSSGEVHVFDRWATTESTAVAEKVGQVEDAVGIVGPEGACGPPTITTTDGDAVVVSDTEVRP